MTMTVTLLGRTAPLCVTTQCAGAGAARRCGKRKRLRRFERAPSEGLGEERMDDDGEEEEEEESKCGSDGEEPWATRKQQKTQSRTSNAAERAPALRCTNASHGGGRPGRGCPPAGSGPERARGPAKGRDRGRARTGGVVRSRAEAERVKLDGSVQLAEEQLAMLENASCCTLCQSEFASDAERATASQTMRTKVAFLRTKLRKLDVDMGRPASGYVAAAAGGTQQQRQQQQGPAQPAGPHRRLGYINYFRSLRSEGMNRRSCPVCCKSLEDLGTFLSTTDRYSYLAGRRFFDSDSDSE